MDSASVEAALTITPTFDYTTEWSEGDFVMTIKPLTNLASFTRYTIQLGSSARSDVGIPIGDTSKITFTGLE